MALPQLIEALRFSKILVSVKFVSQFWGRNGCANFMDAWKNASVLQEKAMSIKFLVLGGGILGLGGGGGSADFIFMGTGIFLIDSEALLQNRASLSHRPMTTSAAPQSLVVKRHNLAGSGPTKSSNPRTRVTLIFPSVGA